MAKLPECVSYTDQVLFAVFDVLGLLGTKLIIVLKKVAPIFSLSADSSWHLCLLATLHVCIVAYAIQLVGRMRQHVPVNRRSLKRLVEEHKRTFRAPTLREQGEKFILWLSMPSRRLFGLYFLLFGVGYFVAHSCSLVPDQLMWPSSSNDVQNFLTMLMGIATILFVLIVFIAEIGRADRGRYAVRIFLIRTGLLALVPLCL